MPPFSYGMNDLRYLPSVDKLLGTGTAQEMVARYGRPLTVEAIRVALEQVRTQVLDGQALPNQDVIIGQADQVAQGWTRSTLMPVINATGVIIHTNLGRAPLSPGAIQAISEVAQGYSNLEYDLGKGRRGSRLLHAEELLVRLTGAEAAIVVNNNAAAVLLSLTSLSNRRRVLIARTQLVEIGGGFRLPDVMAQSGARLVEIGTTNRVHLRDYQQFWLLMLLGALILHSRRGAAAGAGLSASA